MSLLNVLEPLCARGFLRQATRLCLTSKAVAAVLQHGTGRQLYDAAKAGNDGELMVYLEYWRGSSDIYYVLNWKCNDYQTSPLAAAAESDSLVCLELLLTFVPELCVNKGHPSALTWACRHGRAAAVRALLAVPGIVVSLHALSEAAERGHAEVVRLLVAVKGIELINHSHAVGVSPLELASMGGHDEVVAILTEAIEK